MSEERSSKCKGPKVGKSLCVSGNKEGNCAIKVERMKTIAVESDVREALGIAI